MGKRLLILGVVLLVAGAAVLAGFSYLAPKTIQAEGLGRAVPGTLYFGKQPIPVVGQLNLASYADCQPGRIPLDIVVAVDQSDSMKGPPVEQAAAGALQFVQSLDLSVNQVGLILFNGQVTKQIGLSSNIKAITTTLKQPQVADGTDIALVLQAARNELQSMRRRLDANAVVVLFTDGGSDSAAALAAAQDLKRDRTQIFVIGLRGATFDEQTLRQIASRPETVRIAPTPAELIAAFQETAQAVKAYVLTDLRYFEPVNLDGFNIDVATLPSRTVATSDGLLWQADALTKEQIGPMSQISYTITPKQYGFLGITSDEASLSLAPCGGMAVQSTLPAGPRVLVMPPLAALLVAPVGLLLTGIAFSAGLFSRFGKPKEPAQPSPSAPLPVIKSAEMPKADTFSPGAAVAGWLQNVEQLGVEAGRTPEEKLTTQPTLIIGLGASGRTVLAQIATHLNDRFGPKWPGAVRLLQVSLPVEGKTPMAISGLTEVLLSQATDKFNFKQPHLRWAAAHQHSKRTRGQGRLALFADLAEGKGRSQLWGPMGNSLAGQSNLAVWIVADAFSSDSSGLIADIAHLVRTRASGVVSSVRLCLAMHNARWQGQGNTQQLAARSFATLRELQRLQRAGVTPFIYAPYIDQTELNASSNGKLLDEIYIFDGKGEDTAHKPFDISNLPAEDGVLRVIGNGLLVLLEPGLSQRFYENEKNTESRVTRSGGTNLEDYGSTLGCASLRAPIEPTRRLAECRLVHHTLFHPEEGLWGWELLDEQGKSAQSGQVTVPERARDVEDFWTFARFQPATLAKTAEPERLRTLVNFLQEKMNDGTPLRLRWALGFLRRLEAASPYGPALQTVRGQLQQWIDLVGSLRESTTQVGGGAEPAGSDSILNLNFDMFGAAPAGLDLSPTQSTDGTLLQMWRARWEAARAAFPKESTLAPERPAWCLADEYNLYQRYLPSVGQNVARLRQRVYWLWSLQDRNATLRLLVLPTNLSSASRDDSHRTVYDEIQANPYSFALLPDRSEDVLARLLDAAKPYTRGLFQESVAPYLRLKDAEEFLALNSSLLSRQVKLGESAVAATPYAYLLMPPNAKINIETTAAFPGSDPGGCSLVRVHHVLKLANLMSYQEALAAYYPDPELHVFEREQAVVRREQVARDALKAEAGAMAFSSDAILLLGRAEAHCDLLGRLLAQGVISPEQTARGWIVKVNNPVLLALIGLPLRELLHRFIERVEKDTKLSETLEADVKQQAEAHLEELVSWIEAVRTDVIEKLVQSDDPALTDLALLCAYALNQFTGGA